MKTSRENNKQLFKGFVNWLNKSYYYKVGSITRKFRSGHSYGEYMGMAIQDLGMRPEDFKSNSRPGILKAMMSSLENTASFLQRDVKIQSDITSAFKAYIKYHYATSK